MFETSRDLLNIVLAFAVLWVTIFLIWMMWYVISMLRNINRIAVNARKKMETVDTILDLVKDKLEKGSNHMSVLADSAIKLVGFLMEKQGVKAEKKRKKR